LNISLAWVEEFSRYMFVWVTFMAATLVFSEAKDLKFEWLFEKCGIKARRLIELITLAGVIVFMAVVLYQGMSYTARVFWMGTASIPNVPRGFIYLILPLFSCIIIFLASMRFIEILIGCMKPPDGALENH
jgi:TRAP-type C4-dicarboxylate transport system permease small subunit